MATIRIEKTKDFSIVSTFRKFVYIYAFIMRSRSF